MTTYSNPSCVLVVDDNDDSRNLISAFLLRAGHEVSVAASAAEAFALLQKRGFDRFYAVATDYWMPGGTGLDLLRKTHAFDPTLAFLIITADTEKFIVADTLRSGGCDCLEKPVSGPRVLESVARAISLTREQRRQRDTVRSARALGRDQLRLLERHTSALADRISLYFHSQAEASGDFLSVIPLGDERFALFASDAAGHDLPAAFQSNYFHGLARGMMAGGASIGGILSFFNRLLLREWNTERIDYSLAALGVRIDFKRGTLDTFNCGFPAPLVSDGEGWAEALAPETTSNPLGWFEAASAPADRRTAHGYLTLWSDGLTALAEHLQVDPLSLSHRLLSRTDGHEGLLAGASDDVAVARIRISVAPDVAASVPLFSQCYSGSAAARIDELNAFFERSLRLALPHFSEERLLDALVATHEALLNALVHGCRGHDEGGSVKLQAALSSDRQSLRVRVQDTGAGHNFDLGAHEIAAATQMLTQHRGLILVKNLATRLSLSESGATVAMEFDA